MRILGLSCYFHDAAAALLEDGLLVAAAEEERFTRKKHDFSFPERAIQFCLDQAGIQGPEVDYVAFFEKPLVKFERLLLSSVYFAPRSRQVFQEAMQAWLADKLWIKEKISDHLGIPPERVLFLEHHLSHASAAFFCSPFEEAAVMTVDGVGEWTTATLGRGRASFSSGANGLEILSELSFPHSLGLLYSAFTAFLGFEVNEGEYKVMGLAPFGEARYVREILRTIDLKEDGSFAADPSYYSYAWRADASFTRRLTELLGPPRTPGRRFVTSRASLFDDPAPPTAEELASNQKFADIAASIQKVTEDILLKMARELHRRTGLTKLAIGGGVGYNCVANARILRETPFNEIYIHPASGDSGAAAGAALYAWHVLFGKPRRFVMRHAYWGKDYGADEMRLALRESGLSFTELSPDRLVEQAADLLKEGHIVGLCRGRFEWGPRALGHRSILADPTRPDMKDRVNIAVKFREPFRPFAPAVIAEEAGRWFDLGKAAGADPLRFMLMTLPVKPEAAARVPAVVHADRSARAQLVYPAAQGGDPFFYDLLNAFGRRSGVPMLLNTSFNLKGEPIVAAPKEAVSTFLKSGMDALVLGPFLARK